jgi:hypothetical protein
MTITSPDHALAYAHICDLMRTAAQHRRLMTRPRRRFAPAAGWGQVFARPRRTRSS